LTPKLTEAEHGPAAVAAHLDVPRAALMSGGTRKLRRWERAARLSLTRSLAMRTMSLTTALILLLFGCGFDPAPTAPEDSALPAPEPVLALPEPELAGATAATNVWTTKAALPIVRSFFGSGAGVLNGALYAVGGNGSDGKKLTSVQAYTPGTNSWTNKAPLP